MTAFLAAHTKRHQVDSLVAFSFERIYNDLRVIGSRLVRSIRLLVTRSRA